MMPSREGGRRGRGRQGGKALTGCKGSPVNVVQTGLEESPGPKDSGQPHAYVEELFGLCHARAALRP
jgi:hypothetical protein